MLRGAGDNHDQETPIVIEMLTDEPYARHGD